LRHRKRVEADVIAGPAWALKGRTFPGIRPPTDDSDRASQRSMMLAQARRALAAVHVRA
jgi:hypothetical protein